MMLGLEETTLQFARLFCCNVGTLLFIYLGIPLHQPKLRKEDIQLIVDKVIKKIAGWNGKLLSYGGRLTLWKSCLTSIPTYLMSIIKFFKWAIESINSQIAHFFWNNLEEGKHKYQLAHWKLVSLKKIIGAWVPDHQQMNMCLLASWIPRYHLSDAAMWRKIIDYKNKIDGPNMFCCSEKDASPFWKGCSMGVLLAPAVDNKLGDVARGSCGKFISFWRSSQ